MNDPEQSSDNEFKDAIIGTMDDTAKDLAKHGFKLTDVVTIDQLGFDRNFMKPIEKTCAPLAQCMITDDKGEQFRAAFVKSGPIGMYVVSTNDDLRDMEYRSTCDTAETLLGTDVMKGVSSIRNQRMEPDIDEQIVDIIKATNDWCDENLEPVHIKQDKTSIVPVPKTDNLTQHEQHRISYENDDRTILDFSRDVITKQLTIHMFDPVLQNTESIPIDYSVRHDDRINEVVWSICTNACNLTKTRTDYEKLQQAIKTKNAATTTANAVTKKVMTQFLITDKKPTDDITKKVDDPKDELLDEFDISINREITRIRQTVQGNKLGFEINPCMSDDIKRLEYPLVDADPDSIAKDVCDIIITEHRNIRLRQQILEG